MIVAYLSTLSMPGRPSAARPWRNWALVYAAVTAGILSCEIAISVSIEGAATAAERSLIVWTVLLTGVTLPAGLAGYVSERRTGDPALGARMRGRLATAMGGFALLVGIGRVSVHARDLARHVGARADEPITTLSLALQLLFALASTAALTAFAVHERTLARDARMPP